MSDHDPTRASVDGATAPFLQRYGFDAPRFEALRAALRRGELGAAANRLEGDLQELSEADLAVLPSAGSEAHRRLAGVGAEAIRAGQVAAVILAGGMATRFGGLVKATVPVLDGLSFLELKVRDIRRLAAASGGRIPIYLMSSFATDPQLREEAARLDSAEAPVRVFAQGISLRLRPDGEIFRGADGEPSPYAPGHGDLGWALRRSGALRELHEQGCLVLTMSNVDNLGATLDPAILGGHIEAEEAITVEVVRKREGDRGGAPARVDGKAQIVESFRFPESFDQDRIPVFNTNTLVFDAARLEEEQPLSYFAVTKEVEGQSTVQLERLVGQLTAFLPSRFLLVPRDGSESRFLPVKDPEQLEANREAIREALRERGVL